MEALAWIGLTQSLFGSLLMGTKPGALLPDKILTIWLFLMAFVFLSLGLDLRNNSFTILTSSFLIFNPLLFLYACASTLSDFRLKWIHFIHPDILCPGVGIASLQFAGAFRQSA